MGKYQYWKEKIKPEWIQNGIEDEEPVEWANKFGTYLAKNDDYIKIVKRGGEEVKVKRKILTTSQLRKFFGEIKRLQLLGYDKAKTDILLLKPKLAYAVGRAKDKNAKIHDFYEVITDALQYIKNQKTFENFINLFEAIVAFHKAAEDSGLGMKNKNN